jgi:beta-lactamase superfamily II metal-dependent hydrolase
LPVAGLPNEGEPLGDALIDAARPQLIVFADSQHPASRRASPELKERLAQKGIPVIYTRESGAVKIVIARMGWKAQTMDGQQFASPH